MTIVQWFDPGQAEHREAYRRLKRSGSWPLTFLPLDIEFSPQWQIGLMAKLANTYLAVTELGDSMLRPTFRWLSQEKLEEKP